MGIVDKRIAGIFFVLIPVLFWIYIYIWFDCQHGKCSLPMDWLMVGFFAILFGVFLLVSGTDEKKEMQELKDRVQELEKVLEEKKKAKKNAKQKKTV